jgi:hypothetical protein
MLGTRAASVWTGAAGTWTAESARCSCGTTIEDRLTALDSRPLSCGRGRRWSAGRDYWSLVNRAGTSLRHDDATNGGRRRWRRDWFSRTMSRWLCWMRGCRCNRRRWSRGCGHRSWHRGLLFNRGWSRSRRLRNRCRGRRGYGCSRYDFRRGWRRRRCNCLRLHCDWRGFGRMRLCFSGRRSDRRFDHYGACGWNNSYRRACRSSRRRSLGHNRASRRPASDGAWRLRRDDRGRGTRLRNDLSWFRAGGSSRRRSGDDRCSRLYGRRGRGHSRGFRGHIDFTSLSFFFLLPGQNGFHHIAGLGNIREVNFGRNALRAA